MKRSDASYTPNSMLRNSHGAVAIPLALALMSVGVASDAQTTLPTQASVYVTVTDREGRSVRDLRSDEVSVRVSGKPVALTELSQPRHPVSAVVILDTSASMKVNAPAMFDFAAEFLSRLEPQDRAKVGGFNDHMHLSSGFSSSTDELVAQLKVLPRGQTTPFFDALIAGADALKDERGQRIILVLTDGEDSASKASFAAALNSLHAHGVTVYGVGVESVWIRGANVMRTRPHRDLKRIVEESGGGYIELTKRVDVKTAIDEIFEALRGHYLMTLASPIPDGKMHTLEVTTTRAGVTLRARTAYVRRSQ